MRRRDLLAVLGGAAVAAPVAARAQQKAMPVISYLAPDAPSASASGIAAWREGLAQSGFLEGRNVVVEYRSGSGDYGRMPALAAEFVAQHVDLIMAASLPAAVAAKSATPRMPIAFWVGVHPVAFGLVQSLNRPGGNLTGVTFLVQSADRKAAAAATRSCARRHFDRPVAQPKKPNAAPNKQHAKSAAAALGLAATVLTASAPTRSRRFSRRPARRGLAPSSSATTHRSTGVQSSSSRRPPAMRLPRCTSGVSSLLPAD